LYYIFENYESKKNVFCMNNRFAALKLTQYIWYICCIYCLIVRYYYDLDILSYVFTFFLHTLHR
jgi:hypothetical protein